MKPLKLPQLVVTRTPRRRTPGFTLIELLVVVSIIAVLITILLPALSNARQQVTRTTCLSRQHQLAAASIVYAADSDGQLLPLDSPPIHWVGQAGAARLEDYLADLAVTNCPDYRRGNTLADGVTDSVTDPDDFYAQLGYFYTAHREPSATDLGYAGANSYVMPTTLSQSPQDAVLWADRQTLVTVTWPSRAVHTPGGWKLGNTGDHPIDDLGATGTNVALVDGSALWRPAEQLQPRTMGYVAVSLGWW